MKRHTILLIATIVGMTTVFAQGETKGLKDVYRGYFRIGTILNNFTSNDQKSKDLVLREFNSITPENELKPQSTMVQVGSTDDNIKVQLNGGARRILQFCQDNNIPLRGHTLVWHGQTPGWFFRAGFTNNGELADVSTMNRRMESYIKNIFALIKQEFPKVDLYAYDVVNEAFKNNGGGLRGEVMGDAGAGAPGRSIWMQIYESDEFIVNAFKYARKYAPAGCKLFYNDFNEYMPEKREDMYNLAMKLKAENLIDGIGMQAHLDMSFPSAELFGEAVARFASTGLEVQVTEMDITTSTGDFDAQGILYRDVFKQLLKYKDSVTAVIIWGIQDNQSWRRDRNPTLFDGNGEKKPAYNEVFNLVK